MRKHLTYFFLFINSLLFFGCTIFDSDKTTQLLSYNTPFLTDFSVTSDTITFTININLNPSVHSDFEHYLILLSKLNENINQIENTDLSSYSSFSNVPFFLASTVKPSLNTSSVNPLTITITTNLTVGENYKISVVAYGKNDDYGRLKDSNGWIVSKVSIPQEFNKPYFSPLLTAHFFNNSTSETGYIVKNEQIELVPAPGGISGSVNYDVLFISNQNARPNTVFYISSTTATNSGTLNFLPSQANYTSLIELPTSSTIPPGEMLPLEEKRLYVLKKNDNTYHKIYIDSFSGNNINFYVIYSLTPNKNRF